MTCGSLVGGTPAFQSGTELKQFPRERALALLLSDLGPSEELESALRVVEARDPDDPVATWIRRKQVAENA